MFNVGADFNGEEELTAINALEMFKHQRRILDGDVTPDKAALNWLLIIEKVCEKINPCCIYLSIGHMGTEADICTATVIGTTDITNTGDVNINAREII